MSASTSPSFCVECAERLLAGVLSGAEPDVDLARALARDGCSDALFRVVAEGLADRFEPRLCAAYALLFCNALAELFPTHTPGELGARYERVRLPSACAFEPEQVFVLSRVTLGADIAVTSVVLRAAKVRFPNARITFVGSAKNAALWAADRRIEHLVAPYPRTGSLADRLGSSFALRPLLAQANSIVLDPDSRLSQLGLVPVCEEERYFFFESRGYGGTRAAALQELTAEWCGQVLGVENASAYIALPPSERKPGQIAVSFGVGDNPAKRLGDAFEAGLLSALGGPMVIDSGIGGAESERVRRAVATSGVEAEVWSGSFAGFASRIAESSLYVGYDSAGQHAAAALGTPLVTVFAGHVSERMFQRWRPSGTGLIQVVNAGTLTAEEALGQTVRAVQRIRTP